MTLTPTTRDAQKLFHDGILALGRAERNGIHVDVPYIEKTMSHLTRQIERLEKKVKQSDFVTKWRRRYGSKFNLGSNDQLADILFEVMGLEPIKTTDKGSPSTDEESLEALDVPELQDMLRVRKLKKARDTYLQGFLDEQVDGIIHPNFNLHLARSYRPSTDSPNLANVPKRNAEIQKIIRQAVIPRPGHKILSGDFKGVEVSVAYDYHLDPEMKTYLLDKSTDMHRDMAARLFLIDMLTLKDDLPKSYKMLRHSGKNEFVFPQFYGDWWKSCAGSLWASAHGYVLQDGKSLIQHLKEQGIKSLEQFEKHVESVENWMWNEKWPVYTQWKKDWWEDYCKKGYFDTLTGFRCSAIMDRKQACNYPIQGSAFHCMLQCIIWLTEDSVKENWDSYIMNQIYDDVMFDIHPKEEKMVIERMKMYMTERLPEHWSWIKVPLEVEIDCTKVDGSWYDKSESYLQ